MFKVTCFAPVEPQQFKESLKALRFVEKKGGWEWYLDGHVFRIEPFLNQARESMKGYRVTFNGSIDGGIYLFDMSFGGLSPSISGIEYKLQHATMKTVCWLKELRKRASFQIIDPRGLFQKEGVSVIVVNDEVTLQVRAPKGKKIKLIEVLKKIEMIRDEITPVEFDLFSFSEERDAV